MRKIIVTIFVLIPLLLTGCGNKKTLDCNQSLSTAGIKQDIQMLAEYDGDNIVYYGLTYDMDLSSLGSEEVSQVSAQDMCSVIKANLADSGAITNCKQKVENMHLIITADYDLDEILSSDDENRTIEELKTGLESQNYTCTIK